jgi:uroporphyrinogen decarboxylase
MSKSILETFNRNNKTTDIPIWLMRQAGRYLPEYRKVRSETKGFLDLCYNSDLACEVTLQPIRRFKLDAAIIFSDILVVPDAMGVKVDFKENHGPILEKIQTKESLELALNKQDNNKLSPVYQAIKKTKEQLPKDIALIGFSGAVWTIASYMVEGKLSRDLSVIKPIYYNDKKFFEMLIDHLVENISQHLINQVKAGVEVLQIFDSWAGMLIGEDYENLIIKPTQRIIEKVKAVYPEIPIICFPRMSGLQYEKFCQEVDCQAIGIDQYMSLDWIRKHNNGKIIQGNLDPLVLLSQSKDFIKRRVDQILSSMKGEKFIFNLGHGVIPNIPPENVEFLVNHVKGSAR